MGATGQTPLVGIVMGSRSDWETMQYAAARLEQLGVAHEVRVVSAHRTPDVLFEYAASADARALAALGARAGREADLPARLRSVLAVVYLLALVLSELMSNAAAAVLLVPIAVSAAIGMGLSPSPFLVAVTFAASTSFSTPVGYQTNTMVYSIGGYRFTDFMRVGIPLNLLFWVIGIVMIPRIWPFTPLP